eukprot:TRINITY_DN581_c0_g1_i1.p1 TRINITY_DN581_c0_g1~~TRINITY_DN581_c0_g1_i1.p1  ORF type:complete len:389 (-),score=77.22 TRINITY_DN581_c0_g1_i1:66-1232(-)
MLESIRYKRGNLQLLDQKKLPHVQEYVVIGNAEDGWKAIADMQVRGAPAIAVAGALSVAIEAHQLRDDVELATRFVDAVAAAEFIATRLSYLVSSRPTAVNLSEAAVRLSRFVREQAPSVASAQALLDLYVLEAERMLVDDIATNQALGKHGAEYFRKNIRDNDLRVLTHCNTGSLATAGYGTALGVIRALNETNSLKRAFCTETRPYNQGSRLTAYELVHEKIPACLVTDSMAGALMSVQSKGIDAVVVGADRVAANGDTANKVGTYTLAICAKHHNIPFFVASPLTTIDLAIPDGSHIHIEERPSHELTTFGGVSTAAAGIDVWNPAFDVTPASLIHGIITEYGVITKNDSGVFDVANFIATHRPATSTSTSTAPVAKQQQQPQQQ